MQEKIEKIQREITILQVNQEHLEKQDKRIENEIRTIQKDFDTKFEAFEKKINEKLDNIEVSLKSIQEIVTEAKGGWKAIAKVGSIVVFSTSVLFFILNYFK